MGQTADPGGSIPLGIDTDYIVEFARAHEDAGFDKVLVGYASTTADGFMVAAHAAANPLTGRFGIVHGEAIAVLLPHVIRHNGRDPETAHHYGDLVRSVGLVASEDSDSYAVGYLADALASWIISSGLKYRLKELGISRDILAELAEEATKEWTGTFNPVEMNADSFGALYESAYE